MRFPIRRLRTCRAFTIVELMVSIALVLMLMGVAVFIFISAVKIFVKTSAETELYQAAQVALETMRLDIQGCMPHLTQDQVPNGQQFIVKFDTADTVTGYAFPWKFDRLCFRTTTADPATGTGTSADRWVFYWVQGYNKGVQDGVPGTLMKYVSPGTVPPQKTAGDLATSAGVGADETALVAATAKAPGFDTGTIWLKDESELCQNVTFFGVEVFYDPDADSTSIGQFFSNATAVDGIPSYNPVGTGQYDTLFDPYVITSPLGGYLAINTYADAAYATGYDAVSRVIRLPTQLRITLRIRDRDKNASVERTLQIQVGIPVAN